MKKLLLFILTGLATLQSMHVQAQCNPTTIPYYEGFQGLTALNQLPPCWAASNLGSTCLTYTQPGQAAFSHSVANTSYFHSGAVQLLAGVTYSLAIWKKSSTAQPVWTDLSVLVGTTQSPTGLVSLLSSNGPVTNTVYALLNGTFTIASSGNYYFAVRGTGTTTTTEYLYFDEFQVTIPCQLNSPPVSLSASNTTLCAGQGVTLTASGANTYLWNTGATTAVITVTPNTSTTFSVTGTHTASGCTAGQTEFITVNPTPVIGVISSALEICAGETVTLSAYGNPTFTWNFGGSAPTVTIAPTVDYTFSVSCTNSYGCSNTASGMVWVNALPLVTANAPTLVCVGQTLVLTATGANSYAWHEGLSVTPGNTYTIVPTLTKGYTLKGTDNDGCTGQETFIITVDGCTGINEVKPSATQIYPNPTAGIFTVVRLEYREAAVTVTDVTGRIVLSNKVHDKIRLDLGAVPNGLYFVTIESLDVAEVYRLVKE